MNKFDAVDEILENLVNSGSVINYLKELRSKSIDLINKDLDLKETLYEIANDIQFCTLMFLNAKNEYNINFISGISTGIYLPYNGSYKLKIFGGTTKRNGNEFINEDTLFDIASITKLYTLVLLFKLEELGLIDLNKKISDINPDIQGLEDYTLNDLIRLHGILRTKGNVATSTSFEEAYEKFKTVYLLDNSRENNTYTDFGAMVIADTIEKVLSNYFNKEMKIDEIMNRFLFIPLGIKNTTYTPGTINIAGNNNDFGLPHDPKSRILGGKVGHAGLFTNSEDLMKLSLGIMDGKYLNKNSVSRLGEITFDGSSRGNLGIFVKHLGCLEQTYTPQEYSTGSFSHQGWTGGVATFDINNKIHNNILVNAIYNSDNQSEILNDKPIKYKKEFIKYQSEISKRIMLMYVVKKYYNKYIGYSECIEEKRILKK